MQIFTMITLTPSTALSHNSGPALQRQSSAAVSQLTLNGLRKEKPGPVGIPAFHTGSTLWVPPHRASHSPLARPPSRWAWVAQVRHPRAW
mmetsp:Transcript_29267/g.46150  ORF Transcript_29267/g.46150 Transcript_29267/m.46150 type:complete len:90 (+) Transcript_29267:201-470(+)